MEKSEVKSKEDLIQFILLELNKKVHHILFGDLFMEMSPSGGIESFRSMLDELCEEGLLVKTTQTGSNVPGYQGLQTVDLRYGISVKGIRYLKDNGLIQSKANNEMKKEVF